MLEELRDILKKIGGRFIIIEEGKPRYVILDFEEFKNLISKLPQNPDEERKLINPAKNSRDEQMLEDGDSRRVNEKLSDLKQQSAEEIPRSTELTEEEPTIEDIPL